MVNVGIQDCPSLLAVGVELLPHIDVHSHQLLPAYSTRIKGAVQTLCHHVMDALQEVPPAVLDALVLDLSRRV